MILRNMAKPTKLPVAEVRDSKVKKVAALSELELKTRNKGVFGIKREGRYWVGLVEVSA